jgi:hypothetical protein
MNGPGKVPDVPEMRIVFAIPRFVVIWFAGALILNATTMLLLATALVTHLIGGRP